MAIDCVDCAIDTSAESGNRAGIFEEREKSRSLSNSKLRDKLIQASTNHGSHLHLGYFARRKNCIEDFDTIFVITTAITVQNV